MKFTRPTKLVFLAWAALALLVSQTASAAPTAHNLPRGVDLEPLLRLKTHLGRQMVLDDIRGKPVLLFFGYTHCPEICPTSLLDMTLHLKNLGPEADRMKVFFVTVDPERDTTEDLSEYLSNFDERIIGLTGRPEDVNAVASAFGATLTQNDQAPDNYSVSHTTLTFMIDRYGMLAQTVSYGDSKKLDIYSRRLLAQ